ncbi:MAG: CDGSH iron-sulfur domain-containing protein [Planctomycetota bacterium]
MPRLVRFEATGPVKIEPQDKPVFVCGCGLSQNMPLCDGSHKACKAEEDGRLYVYDASRTKIVEEQDDG